MSDAAELFFFVLLLALTLTHCHVCSTLQDIREDLRARPVLDGGVP